MILNQNLKKKMSERNLSCVSLAKEVDTAASTIHVWLNGSASKLLSYDKKVTNYFGLTIDELYFAKHKIESMGHERVIGELGDVEIVNRYKKLIKKLSKIQRGTYAI